MRQLGGEALLYPPVAGAEHLGEPEGEQAREYGAGGGTELLREREAVREGNDPIEGLRIKQPYPACQEADDGEPGELEGVHVIATRGGKQWVVSEERPKNSVGDNGGKGPTRNAWNSKSSR